MLRTCVLCCAMAGLVGLTVGCNLFGDNKSATQKRDEAVTAMKAELEKMDKKLAELKDKADKAAGDEKAKLEAKWKDSSAKREAFAKKLEELKAAAADKWEAVKKDADKSLDELKKAVE